MDEFRVLQKFEALMKEVDALYTVYKINKEAKAPYAQRRQLEQLFSRVKNMSFSSNVDNYKRTNLLQRFNILKEKWEKMIDEREIGIIRGTRVEYSEVKVPDHDIAAESSKSKIQENIPKPAISKDDEYKNIYSSFKDANTKLGKKTPDFDKFKAFLKKMENNIKSQKNANSIEFSIKIEGGKPTLKAKIKK